MPHKAWAVSARFPEAYDIFVAQILIHHPVLVFYYHHMV